MLQLANIGCLGALRLVGPRANNALNSSQLVGIAVGALVEFIAHI